MQKDFDKWNKQKKLIHQDSDNKLYRTRDVWWCAFGINIGFEQDGTGEEGERPALIMRGFSRQVCLVVPLTTSKKKNLYHVSAGIIDGKSAFAIISQIRLIDTKRLINKIGVLDKALFQNIRKTVKDLL